MFDFLKSKPVLTYDMRTYRFEPDTNRVYLYNFGGVKINGYIIREEVAHDLLLRGLPTAALRGVRGQLFVSPEGAGLVLEEDWLEATGEPDALLTELCQESAKLAKRKC